MATTFMDIQSVCVMVCVCVQNAKESGSNVQSVRAIFDHFKYFYIWFLRLETLLHH